MKFIAIAIVVELIFSFVFLTVRHPSPAILGTKTLAQADTSTPTDTPTDTPTSTDTSTPQESPIPTSSPTDTSSPLETSTPSGQSIIPTSTNNESPNIETPIATSPENTSTNATESSPLSDQTISALDSTSVTNDTSNVEQNVLQQIANENQQTAKATTPETQVQSLVNAGQMDVQIIDSSLKTNSLASVNLVTEDLSQHIDKSLSTLDQTSSDQKPVLKQNLTNLCTNANINLRSSEEMVLEESEQDMEIVRAKCFNVLNR